MNFDIRVFNICELNERKRLLEYIAEILASEILLL